jgi:hypothetical protein
MICEMTKMFSFGFALLGKIAQILATHFSIGDEKDFLDTCVRKK